MGLWLFLDHMVRQRFKAKKQYKVQLHVVAT